MTNPEVSISKNNNLNLQTQANLGQAFHIAYKVLLGWHKHHLADMFFAKKLFLCCMNLAQRE